MKKKIFEETIKGIITKVFYNQDGFFSGIIDSATGNKIRVCGAMTANLSDAVIVRGSFENNKYGDQFKVTSFEYNMHFDNAGIIHYITRNPAMKGIGPQRARAIAAFCGAEFDNIVTDEPKRLLAIKGITPDIVTLLHNEWVKYKSFNFTITFFAGFGVTLKQINSLINKYGNSALRIMKENPYIIIDDIPGYGFKKADIIALKMGLSKDDPNRIHAGILFLVQQTIQDGDTWIEFEDLVADANKLLIMDTLDSCEIIKKRLDKMIEDDVFTKFHFDNRILVTLPSIYNMEEFISDTFKRLCRK